MVIGVPREITEGEHRIALVPDSIKKLGAAGLEVLVESAGSPTAVFSDADFEAAGAKITSDTAAVWASDLVVKVAPPTERPGGGHEVDLLREGATLICALAPYQSHDAVRRLTARRVTSFALELMPRITRAQDKDILSAMSTLTGYKAVLIAANALPKLMPMMMTAAGTLKPARVLVLGAGVAGLQAIATARRLGAIVEAFDIRLAAKEQVESLGARFVGHEALGEDAEAAGGYARELTPEEQDRQREILSDHIAASDVVITTALVPGRKAPVLLVRDQVERMSPGSLIVDLAAEQGGNCELTRAGEVVDHGGVEIHGPTDVASSLPVHASQMFARCVQNYLLHLTNEGELNLDPEDELVSGPLITRDGEVANESVRSAMEA